MLVFSLISTRYDKLYWDMDMLTPLREDLVLRHTKKNPQHNNCLTTV